MAASDLYFNLAKDAGPRALPDSPHNPPTRQPANPPTRQPASPPTRQPANPPTRQPANPPTLQPAPPLTTPCAPPGPGAVPMQANRLSTPSTGNWRPRGPSQPVLPCTPNDYFLQKVRSRLRKTILSGSGPRKASPSKTEPGQPGTNASRTAKKILPPVQVKRLPIPCAGNWRARGPSEPRLPCRRNDDFSKRYALVYVKRYYLKLGPCWDGPGVAQVDGTVTPERPRAELSPAWRPTYLCSRAGETTTFSKRYALVYAKRYFQAAALARRAPSKTEPGPAWYEREQDAKKILPPVQVKRLPIPCAGNWRARGPLEPVLPCRRNDYLPQKVRSRLRKTSTCELRLVAKVPY